MSRVPLTGSSKIVKAIRNIVHLANGKRIRVRGFSKNAAKSDLATEFKVGLRPTLFRKQKEYMRQLERQLDGLNSMTASDLLHNLKTVKRGGLAQKEAREKFRAKLIAENREALRRSGVAPAEAERRAAAAADKQMSSLAALHEPDIVAGGKDVIGLDGGLPSMGDRYVNSSIGRQWRENREALERLANDMIANGRGGENMNVAFILR